MTEPEKWPRDCRYGHGALEELPQWYALVGVNKTLSPGGPVPSFAMAGHGLALRVWRCPACSYVELVDERVE